MKRKRIIDADTKSCLAMICKEEDCRWRRVCSNHITAGDFRSEGGSRPVVYLEHGKVVCETFYSDGDGVKYNELPTHIDDNWNYMGQDAVVLLSELVEKADDYKI